MNPTTHLSDKGKIVGQTGFLGLIRQLVLEKENYDFKPIKMCLKIDLVTNPARAQGLVNT